MCKFQDLEYCKTDLVASKGVVFCKFQKSSSALQALEDVNMRGMVRNTPGMCLHHCMNPPSKFVPTIYGQTPDAHSFMVTILGRRSLATR